ncbi:hypothetical protein [Novipirellula artificiosorum]|uniref:Uncharacterized protein n=1 Tax=Novipirellula artificiosorum TaxID=2528016 RepID=A0A5C6E419_9BACT|nr:hypothetical protein [Novipirellula artificiosorum]TWU41959.1 hypothetical protein Poly41_02550 [Novipirellula artificiosorum]
MNDTQSTLSQEEIAQIEEHKYFLSEKAGYDVGWEHAEQEWRENFCKPSSEATDPIENATQTKGLGRFFKRLLSREAV